MLNLSAHRLSGAAHFVANVFGPDGDGRVCALFALLWRYSTTVLTGNVHGISQLNVVLFYFLDSRDHLKMMERSYKGANIASKGAIIAISGHFTNSRATAK